MAEPVPHRASPTGFAFIDDAVQIPVETDQQLRQLILTTPNLHKQTQTYAVHDGSLIYHIQVEFMQNEPTTRVTRKEGFGKLTVERVSTASERFRNYIQGMVAAKFYPVKAREALANFERRMAERSARCEFHGTHMHHYGRHSGEEKI